MKTLAALAALAAVAAIAPAAASARPGVEAAVRTIHGPAAMTSASLNVLTLNDFRGIDNRISVFTGPTGRLTLTAPEGLGDPDGSGSACALDNAKPGESTAPQVSCAPGYIGAIVGDLGRGSDTVDADPSLAGDDRRRDRRRAPAARGGTWPGSPGGRRHGRSARGRRWS